LRFSNKRVSGTWGFDQWRCYG